MDESNWSEYLIDTTYGKSTDECYIACIFSKCQYFVYFSDSKNCYLGDFGSEDTLEVSENGHPEMIYFVKGIVFLCWFDVGISICRTNH